MRLPLLVPRVAVRLLSTLPLIQISQAAALPVPIIALAETPPENT
jgi:hypothetical protein